VVPSDIDMADEDGYALIRRLRALPRDRAGETPAAGLTGLSTVEHRGQAGFQYYVAKPVDARLLARVVATLAARSVAARKIAALRPAYPTSERRSGTATARSAG
jgi:CheY-like chemotaxis protein